MVFIRKDSPRPGPESALTLAVGIGLEDISEMLIKKNADVNAVASEGKTALMRAAMDGNEDLVKLLLEHGAKLEARTKVLSMAQASHYEEIDTLRILLLAGASSEPFPEDASRETLDRL